MHSLRTIPRAVLVFVLIYVANAGDGLRAQIPKSTAQPRSVQVTGDDYRFVDFPATLQPGLTAFSFRNQGRVRHEINIVLLKAELTVDEINKQMQSDPAFLRSTDVSESFVGVLYARAGESSAGRLSVDLLRGRRYLVICNFQDNSNAPFHRQMGMIQTFDVR